MRAGAFNTLGIALLGSAFILPVIRDSNLSALLEVRTWVWIFVGAGLPMAGVKALGRIKPEE